MSTNESFDAADYVDAAAAALGLTLDPAHRPGVVANMERIAELSRLVMEFPLEPETEPLPLYRP